MTKQEALDEGLNLDIEFPEEVDVVDEDICSNCGAELTTYERQLTDEYAGQCGVCVSQNVDVVDEDWLAGVSCNPNAPEECESCQ